MTRHFSMLAIFFCLLLLGEACKKTQKNFHDYFKHSLKLETALGPGFKLIDLKITNDTAVVKTGNLQGDSKIIIINLKNKVYTSLNNLKSNLLAEDVMYEWFDGELIYTSISKPDTLHFLNAKYLKYNFIKLDNDKIFSSTNLVSNKNQFFFLGNLFGISVYNNKRQPLFLRNRNTTLSGDAGTISLPVNDSLNLLSGYTLNGEDNTLAAIDAENNVKWKQIISLNRNCTPIQIFSYSNFFVVANCNEVQMFQKKTGQLSLERVFKDDIVNLSRLDDFIVITTESENHNFETHPESRTITFYMQSLSNLFLNNKTSYAIKTLGQTSIAIVNEDAIVCDLNSSRIIDLKTHKVKFNKTFQDDKLQNYAFKVIKDPHTYKTYILTYNNVLYW